MPSSTWRSLALRAAARDAEPAVVLIHGASGNMEDMRLALGEKLAASHRVILIDRPGHGWSSRPAGDTYASPARQADWSPKRSSNLASGAQSWWVIPGVARLQWPMRLRIPTVLRVWCWCPP